MSANPGFSFTSLQNTIKQLTDGPLTNRCLILGSALDGPIGVPVKVDATNVAKFFGPAAYQGGYYDPVTGGESGKYAGATIPLAVSQVLAAGCQDIYAVRVSGDYATGTLGSLAIAVTSRNPGRIYNTVALSAALSGNSFSLVLTQPNIKGGTITLTSDATGTTLGEFISRVNNYGVP